MQINFLLTSPMENRDNVSTLYFENEGSGHQCNTTEGIRYDTKDYITQFIRVLVKLDLQLEIGDNYAREVYFHSCAKLATRGLQIPG